MWSEYLHHLFIQFPIVGSLGIALLAIFYVKIPADNLEKVLRLSGGLILFALIGATLSGIISAPGTWGNGGPQELSHHRNMGLMILFFAFCAVIAFEVGIRSDSPFAHYIKKAALLLWIAIAFGAIGVGHWGGSYVHSDKIPWDGSRPAIDNEVDTNLSERPK